MRRPFVVLVGVLPLLAMAACGPEPAPVAPVGPRPIASSPAPPASASARALAAAPPWNETPDADFRKAAPAAGPKVAFRPPVPRISTLKNGVKVYLLERHDLPLATVQLTSKVGAGDLGALPGVAFFTGWMLEQGAGKRDALQISDDYEALGAQHGSSFGWDSGTVYVKVPVAGLDRALEILADVALRPTFPDGEIDRLRSRWLAQIQQEKQTPRTMGTNALAAVLYGRAHPYGHSLSGEADDAKRVTRKELARVHEDAFAADRVAISVAGDVSPGALLPRLEALFGGMKRSTRALAPVPKAAQVKDPPRLVVVDKPGATQSQVLVSDVGLPFGTKDREAVWIMSAILGEMFSSRINLNLRERNAYTYGAGAGFQLRHGEGPFSAGGAIFGDKTVPAIGEIFSELNAMRDRDVTADELELAKDNIRLALPARFETTDSLAGMFATLFVHDLPPDEYEKRLARIDAVTIADVRRVAQAYLKPRQMRVIVVGDRSRLAASLETLRLGPPSVLDAYGNPGK